MGPENESCQINRSKANVGKPPYTMPTKYENPTKGGEFLPTLEEIVTTAKPEGVPKEAAWIWGPDDEVSPGV